jgi:RNA polymerase sigma factor (sigma-70 family)
MAEVDAKRLLAQAKDLSHRYARRLGPDEAADLASEAIARGLERPPADGRMDPWLERIARNLLVDRWRHAQVAERTELPVPEAAPSPEELLLRRERRRLLRRSLAHLPREQRRSILKRYYAAGDDTAVPAATLRTRLHRGLARLRALTRGLLAIVPPGPLLRWVPLAANPAAVLVVMLAQPPALPVASPSPPPPAPASSRPRPALTRPVPAPVPVSAPAPATRRAPPPRAPAAAPPPPSPVRYDFEDDQIEADLVNPDLDPIIVDRKARQRSLIEIPDSFVAAVAKSIEDL